MRDHFKDADYFNNFIREDTERVKRFSDKLEKGEVKEDRILPVKAKVHDLKMGILTARYSKGDPVDALEKEFAELADDWEEVWRPDYYSKNLNMVSLGVLFSAERTLAKKVKKLLEKSNINDWLLNFLLNSLDGGQVTISKEMLFPEFFDGLQKVVYGENKLALLKKYLSGWYTEEKGFYEDHKSSQYFYYGYWSFEAGAIAKILNIDDSSLQDALYYPYDLVHYKR